MFLRTTLIFLLGLPFFGLMAQEKQLSQITNEDELQAIEAIALYPEKERLAILEASMHPEVLVRMQTMQSKTEKSFQDLLFPLTRADQEKFYDLARHPALITELAQNNTKKSRSELDKLLVKYPAEVHDASRELNDRQFNTLVSVNNLFQKYEDDFKNLLVGYPPQTQDAYRTLIKQPEIVEILTDNMNMTVLLGDIYRRNPAQLNKELDELNKTVSERKAKELNDWQKSLQDDPQALAEYEQAAKDYARAEGYDESQYQSPATQHYTTDVYVHHVWQPYPYWFGRPWWHTHNYWYSYPWWYHWGFYYGPGNMIVFVGLPSYGFSYWHFYNPYNFYYYPHFTNVVITHCHRATTGSSMNNVVRQWENSVRNETPSGFLANDAARADRLREYGKFEMEYAEDVQRATGKTPDKREFLNSNKERYPSLKPVLEQQPQRTPENPVGPSRTQTGTVSAPPVQNRTPNPVDPQKSESRPIDRATDYHQNTWRKPAEPSRQDKAPVQRQPTVTPPAQRQPDPPQRTAPPSQPKQPSNPPQRGGNQRAPKR
jgi:hypothetical protein